ncbi:hypothetical protein OF377_02880 [Ureaplasma sp. ES3154-GEN]|uniref:hypothetical protein n=1 Tax=Ureaplasma sp. ES3154-GEN TaxID=2984844 RepID=UPI0021E78C2C|nr:hypothetical protein [Ureaplasma sp. ES3154-GEN]MCV3743806.1 hypothetical protein [Ureaplasma sp. ES3154-GEN]
MKKNKKQLVWASLGVLSSLAMIASVAVACKSNTQVGGVFADTDTNNARQLFEKYEKETTDKYIQDKHKNEILSLLTETKSQVNEILNKNVPNKQQLVQKLINESEEKIHNLINDQQTIDWTVYNERTTLSYANSSTMAYASINNPIDLNQIQLSNTMATAELVSAEKKDDGIYVTYTLKKDNKQSGLLTKVISSSDFQEASDFDFGTANKKVSIDYLNKTNTYFKDVPSGLNRSYFRFKTNGLEIIVNFLRAEKTDEQIDVYYTLTKGKNTSSEFKFTIPASQFLQPKTETQTDDGKKNNEENGSSESTSSVDWGKAQQNTKVSYENQENIFFSEVPNTIDPTKVIITFSNPEFKIILVSAEKSNDSIKVVYRLQYENDLSRHFVYYIQDTMFKQNKTEEYVALENQLNTFKTSLTNPDNVQTAIITALDAIKVELDVKAIAKYKQKEAEEELQRYLDTAKTLNDINTKIKDLETKQDESQKDVANTLVTEIKGLFTGLKEKTPSTFTNGFYELVDQEYKKLISLTPKTTFTTLGSFQSNDSDFLYVGVSDETHSKTATVTYKIIDDGHVDITVENINMNKEVYDNAGFDSLWNEVVTSFRIVNLNNRNRLDYMADSYSRDYIGSRLQNTDEATGLFLAPGSLSFVNNETYTVKLTENNFTTFKTELLSNNRLVYKNVPIANVQTLLGNNPSAQIVITDFNMLKDDPNGGEKVSIFTPTFKNDGVVYNGIQTLTAAANGVNDDRQAVVVFATTKDTSTDLGNGSTTTNNN